MKIFTVATHSDGYQPLLEEGCKKNGLELVILGKGEKWQGFVWRLHLMKEYLLKIDPEELVVFVDAWDVLNIKDEKTIRKQFLKFEKDIVLSSEFQADVLSDYTFKKIFGTPCHGAHKINAGMYMGKAGALLEFYEEVHKFSDNGKQKDDQKLFMHACKNSRFFDDRVAIDSQGWLFLNVNGNANPENTNLYRVEGEKILVNRGKSEPCFIHGPGNVNLDKLANIYGFKAKRHPFRPWYFLNFFQDHYKNFWQEFLIGSILLLALGLFIFVKFFAKKKPISPSSSNEIENKPDLEK